MKRSRWTRTKAALSKRLGWLWRPLLYAGVVLGFLFGRAVPVSQVAPFGVALYAAVRGAGFGATAALPVGAAVIAGAALVMGWPLILSAALAVGVCHLGASLLRLGRKGSSPLKAAVVAAVAVTMPVFALPGKTDHITMAFWAGLTAVLAVVFTMGVVDATSGRFILGGTSDSPVPLFVVLAAALCGLDGITLLGVDVRGVVAGVMVMASALVGGVPLAITSGGVLGISLLITEAAKSHPTAAAVAMAYVMAGLLAGLFRELGKAGLGIGYLLGLLTYNMVMVDTATMLLPISYGALASVLLFWLIPRQWLAKAPASLAARGPEVTAPGPKGTESEPAHFMERITGMSRVLKEVGRTFDQVAAVAAPDRQDSGRIFEQVAERVCHTCSMNHQCWGKSFDKSYQLFSDLWEQLEAEGPLPAQPAPEQLEQHCIRPAQIAVTLNYLHDLRRSHDYWERRLEEGRVVVADYLRNMARMLDRFVDEVGGDGAGTRPEAIPVYRVVSGVARLPKRGGHISGDSFVGESLGPDRYLLAISDGMGVGREAATESRQCVKLLYEILKAGFGTEVAVKTVNSALLLHSPEDSFATVDLSLLDLSTGRAEFVKVGAAPSFVKRGSDITVVKMSSVPVGIINQVQVEPDFRVLRPGDLIVMITDGVWDVSKDDLDKERWLINHLSRETATDPEAVAESVLARALELMPEPGDDMTVLVARVEPLGAGGAAGESKRVGGSDWAPVRHAPRLSPAGRGKNKGER